MANLKFLRLVSSYSLCSEVIEGLNQLPTLIHKELKSESKELERCSRYLFDGRGKAVRPTMVLLMAVACNYTQSKRRYVSPAQQTVAKVAEMIHTASLIHDDIIDGADTRRGKPSVNKIWGEKKAVLAGNFVLTQASRALASHNNSHVIDLLTNVIEDLVRGEVMQLNTIKGDTYSLFDQYTEKTFKKTASLMAYSCQAVAVLSQCTEEMCQSAFHYGKNTGLAFQIVDDILDFQTTQSILGKPTSVDLKLGLATAPVLFAAREYPELYQYIKRRFSENGDVKRTIEAVNTSQSLKKSHDLAVEYSEKAIGFARQFRDCPETDHLYKLAIDIVHRYK